MSLTTPTLGAHYGQFPIVGNDPQRTYQPIRRTEIATRATPLPVSSDEATGRLTAAVESELHPTALRIYRALHEVALRVATHRGYAPGVSCVTYHLPTELLAFELAISRTTLWAHTKALAGKGLLAQRGHTTTAYGKRVKDGSLWCVKLNPKVGKSARLTYDDLKHTWRDLEADIQRGHTVYNWIEQSNPREKESDIVEVLVNWALSPGRLGTPSKMTVQPLNNYGPEALLDVQHTPKDERNTMVNIAASAIAAHLGDPSLDFYRYLTWQLLRRLDQGDNRFHSLYTMVLRAGADRREGFARRPGALLVQRLKDAGLWDWIRTTPQLRVGARLQEVTKT